MSVWNWYTFLTVVACFCNSARPATSSLQKPPVDAPSQEMCDQVKGSHCKGGCNLWAGSYKDNEIAPSNEPAGEGKKNIKDETGAANDTENTNGHTDLCKDPKKRRIYFDFDGTIEQYDQLAHDVFEKLEVNTVNCGLAGVSNCATTEHKGFSVVRNFCEPAGCNDWTETKQADTIDKKTNKEKGCGGPCFPKVDLEWSKKCADVPGNDCTIKELVVTDKCTPNELEGGPNTNQPGVIEPECKEVVEAKPLLGAEIIIAVLKEIIEEKGGEKGFKKEYFDKKGEKRVEQLKALIKRMRADGMHVSVLSASWAPIPGAVWAQYLAYLTRTVLGIFFRSVYGIDDPGGSSASNKGFVVQVGRQCAEHKFEGHTIMDKTDADKQKVYQVKDGDGKGQCKARYPNRCAIHIDNSFKYGQQALKLGAGTIWADEGGVTPAQIEPLLWKHPFIINRPGKAGQVCKADISGKLMAIGGAEGKKCPKAKEGQPYAWVNEERSGDCKPINAKILKGYTTTTTTSAKK